MVSHHLHVIIVFHVVTLDDGNFPVDYHKFCVKCTKQRLVKADDLKVKMRHLFWFWQLDQPSMRIRSNSGLS